MPYVRFARDDRGYENTYVLHTVRKEGKSRPRMLYWFRTPPNVRVGRSPLDDDAIRALEENNPDVAFEWNKILSARDAAKAEQSQALPQSRGARKRIGRRASKRATVAAEVADRDLPVADPILEGAVVPLPPQETAEATDVDDRPPRGSDLEEHPVVILLGDKALERLRARYAELQARITAQPHDAEEEESIRTRAEALDPDSWNGLEEGLRGIERFEAEVAEIEAQLARRSSLSEPPGT